MTFVTEFVSRRLAEGGVLTGLPAMHDPVARFFVQTVFIIAICRGLALVSYYLRQPNVIFEIIGGILLGPSAFGRDTYYLHTLFPSSAMANLSLVANIGLVLYLFLVGLELDPKLIKSHFNNAAGISLCGIALPFALGIAISKTMLKVLQPESDVSFPSFFVFIGVAMCITAFPVLARILKEGGLIYTKPGALAMGAAAIDDACAWCLLTLAISIANADNMNTAGYVFLYTVIFAIGLFTVIRPMFEWLVMFVEGTNNKVLISNLFALTLCMVFLCAWVTALLGVHFIFGAFLFGLVVPRGSHLFKDCIEWIEQLVLTFTLPLYFALSGLKTDVTTLRTGDEGAMVILVIVIACAGKFIGCGTAAYFSGLDLRESAVIGALMNTRGLVELIVLNLGLNSGILTIRTFSVMVIMALFTTFITTPIVDFIYPHDMRVRAGTNIKDPSVGSDHDVADVDTVAHAIEIKKFSKEARIALVVDVLGHMQGLIKTLSYFIPATVGSELSVTAMHFIEPTHTTKDEFLGLNEHGKLIRTDEETTDIAKALKDMEDPAAKKPELLPLSMFCKGLDCGINAFRIQGTPEEFHFELRHLARHNDCSFVMMPWRANSLYFQKFFWSTVHVMNLPIALVMQSEATPHHHAPPAAAGAAGTEGSYNRVRARSGSNAAAAHQGAGSYHSDREEDILYSSVERNVLPAARRGTISNTLHRIHRSTKNVSEIVAVITGRQMDLTILPLLLRFSEKTTNIITVFLPRDNDNFEVSVRSGLSTFMKEVNELSHVHVEVLETNADEIEPFFDAVSRINYDLFLSSFVEPNDCSAAPTTRMQRSNSITGSMMEALTHTTDLETQRLNSGVPAQFAKTSLEYPELGRIGSMVLTAQNERAHEKAAKIIIVHESHKMNFTRRTSAVSHDGISMTMDHEHDIELGHVSTSKAHYDPLPVATTI